MCAVAQLVERPPSTQDVAGSNPARGSSLSSGVVVYLALSLRMSLHVALAACNVAANGSCPPSVDELRDGGSPNREHTVGQFHLVCVPASHLSMYSAMLPRGPTNQLHFIGSKLKWASKCVASPARFTLTLHIPLFTHHMYTQSVDGSHTCLHPIHPCSKHGGRAWLGEY